MVELGLLVPTGVDEDLNKLATVDRLAPFGESLLAKAIIQVLTKNDYAKPNGNFAQSRLSLHGQIMKTINYLRTNHRVCVLSNSKEQNNSYRRLLIADPVDLPELSRNVVRLPLMPADPIERPLASRKVV